MTVPPCSPLSLVTLLRQPVTDSDGHRMGMLSDLIVRLGHGDYPLVTGLVVAAGDSWSLAAADDLVTLEPWQLQLAAPPGLREFRRREGEVLLAEHVLGHRLIDVARGAFVKAYDIRLSPVPGGWAATGLDVHRLRWLSPGPHHAAHSPRDWRDFDPLIGHADSAPSRTATSRIHHLKPARIAGIIEDATRGEQAELLGLLHGRPELEADVFEALDRPV